MNTYTKIARIIQYLDEHHVAQPDLRTLADHAGLSPFHLHRLFSRWAGITPKDFLQCLTLSHAKELLRRGESVLNAALDAGLSGPSRLHDLCVSLEAASPGELKSGGAEWTITVGFAESPFGICFVGESPRGICHLSFVHSTNRRTGTTLIREDWPLARLHWDDSAACRLVASLFHRSPHSGSRPVLRAFVRGTSFQVRVWRALLHVPKGALISYGRLAAAVGNPAAARAVGAAVGNNSVAYLSPCHRVIRETGAFGDYRWEGTRKKAIIAWESAIRVRSLSPIKR
jgi:AraC family transcriptional regulator of adaptative response/methylated-DNA-[protein]-cysteine methyltransferase